MFRTISVITVRASDLPDVEAHINNTGRGQLHINIKGVWREVFDVVTEDEYEDYATAYGGYLSKEVTGPFNNSGGGTLIAVRYLVHEKSNASELEDAIHFMFVGDLVEVQWPSEGQQAPTMHPVHKDTKLAITFAGEAWEFMYELLNDLASRHIAVNLNGRDVKLAGVDGDIYDGTAAVLVVNPWVEAERDYVGAEERIRLFHDDGRCAVTQFHIL